MEPLYYLVKSFTASEIDSVRSGIIPVTHHISKIKTRPTFKLTSGSKAEIKLVLANYQNNICAYSGIKTEFELLDIEHIIPESAGGKNSIENYVLVHRALNYSKNALSLIDWLNQRVLSQANIERSESEWLKRFQAQNSKKSSSDQIRQYISNKKLSFTKDQLKEFIIEVQNQTEIPPINLKKWGYLILRECGISVNYYLPRPYKGGSLRLPSSVWYKLIVDPSPKRVDQFTRKLAEYNLEVINLLNLIKAGKATEAQAKEELKNNIRFW